MKTKKFGWSNGQVMDTYENWRKYLVNRCGDLRALDMPLALALWEEAIDRYDDEMLAALEPLVEA